MPVWGNTRSMDDAGNGTDSRRCFDERVNRLA